MLDFLGIGAQKAGTTWLYEMLKLHTQVRFPDIGKEVHFWDAHYSKGIGWYKALFDKGDQWKHGEITPAYAILPRERIRELYSLYPKVRIFYIVRDPMERAWSSALMALARAEMQLEEASDQWFIDHFHSQGSLMRGDYEVCLRNWLSVYPQEQLMVLRYEDIAARPRELLFELAHHIGLDTETYRSLEDGVLHRKVFSGGGVPIRESLKPVLEEIYAEKIAGFQDFVTTRGLLQAQP